MGSNKATQVLEAFGNPSIKVGNTNLIFSRQNKEDVFQIEVMSTEDLITHWKSLTFLNYIYGQVSLNDLQRISLLELEMEQRQVGVEPLKKWYEESMKEFEESQELEDIAYFILEKKDSKGWENALYLAENKFGKEKTEKAFELSKKLDTEF